MNAISQLGLYSIRGIRGFGDFCVFSGQTARWALESGWRRRTLDRLLPQMYVVGTRSVPVVMLTGLFVGMVLAVQAAVQFQVIGMTEVMGAVVNLSVVRELGPVLAGIVLAGRIGGGYTAELGTMRVTEQLDALRAMGANPMRVLVMPRLLACLAVIPLMAVFAIATGILGGYAISVLVYQVHGPGFWRHAAQMVGGFDIFYGLFKAVVFGGVMCLIACYKGFHCRPGAAGVGRACTESFVASCIAILMLNFFIGMGLDTIYTAFGGHRSIW